MLWLSVLMHWMHETAEAEAINLVLNRNELQFR